MATIRRYGLTGGGAGSLDAVDGAALTSVDVAIVFGTDDKVYHYKLDPASGAAENSPFVIMPNTNAGNKRWILCEVYGIVPGVTDVTATSPVVSSGGLTPAISMPAATASVDGHATKEQITKLDGIPAATAESDFIVSGATPFAWLKKTLAEVKTILGLVLTQTSQAIGFTISGGTTSKTLTVPLDASVSGTNTGDQTLPVKATGAELDTGTDDAKFSTAKALKDSHNVPSVAPGTSGNVLASNGTDWVSSAAAAVPVKATGAELDTGTDAAKFATAKALKDSHNVPSVIPGTSGNVLKSDGTDWTSSAPTTYPAETTTTIGALINGATAKTSAVDADYLPLMDSEASNLMKKLSWAYVKSILKTYFDGIYSTFAAAAPGTIGGTTPGIIYGVNAEIFKTASADSPLTALQASGTIVSNYGMTDADCVISLPTAASGLSFVTILPAVRARYFKLRAGTNDKFYFLGVAGSDNGYVGVASGYATGASCSVFTFKASDGNYDWFVIPIFGTWIAS